MIFGWGFRTKRIIGPLGPYTCDICNWSGHFSLVRVITWFTLFFIPVLPYSTNYLVLCPNCQNGAEIERKKVKEFIELARRNKVER